jgi:hypothetical protein
MAIIKPTTRLDESCSSAPKEGAAHQAVDQTEEVIQTSVATYFFVAQRSSLPSRRQDKSQDSVKAQMRLEFDQSPHFLSQRGAL